MEGGARRELQAGTDSKARATESKDAKQRKNQRENPGRREGGAPRELRAGTAGKAAKQQSSKAGAAEGKGAKRAQSKAASKQAPPPAEQEPRRDNQGENPAGQLRFLWDY